MKTLKILSAFLLSGMLGLNSCKKDDPKPAALSIVTTSAATNIYRTSATIDADITFDGGSAVTERGVCFGLTTNPTIADTKVVNGTGKGNFTANLTGLTSHTTYHVRAYSVNNAGVAYGNEITFTTSPDDVYLAGLRYVVGKAYGVVTYWKNGTPTDLTDGSVDIKNVLQIVVSGQDVYVLGNSFNNIGNSTIKLWKNGVMSDITNGTTDCRPAAMAISGNDVYIVGYENTFNGQIAKYWKGTAVTALGGAESLATSIAISGDDLYVAGYEINAAQTNYIAKYWKITSTGTTTISLTDGSHNAYAESIAVSGNDVYVSGEESNNNDIQVGKYWKNGTATPLTDETNYGYTPSIAISGSDAYVVGYTSNKAYIWKNGTPTPLTDGNNNTYGYQIAISGEDIYVAGGNDNSTILWKNGTKVAPFDGTDPNLNPYALFIADK